MQNGYTMYAFIRLNMVQPYIFYFHYANFAITFVQLRRRLTSFNFNALFKKMKSKDYLPNFTGDGIIYVEEMMNYAGYEIHYPQIGINNK